MILGKNLILTVGDESRGLAASKSCDLSIDTDFIEVCSPVNGSWKDYLPTINSWSASVDMLVASLSDHKALLKKQENKEKLMCCFFDTDLQEFYKGYCYIKGLRIKGTTGGLATMAVTIQPTGALEWADENIINMYDGVTVYNKTISYVSDTAVSLSDSSTNILAYSISITEDTRITIPEQGVVCNAELATVTDLITQNDVPIINASIVLINRSGNPKSVILKKRSAGYNVTVIMNQLNTTQNVITLSKF